MKSKKENPRQTIIGNIYETYNYEMFTFLKENRDVNPANVEKIKASMKVKRLLKPLNIGSEGGVYDGQHRFEACVELGLPIHYIVDESLTIDDIPRLNTIAKTWKQSDHLEYYCKRGKKPYLRMRKFILEHNISIRLAIAFLSGADNGDSNNEFKYGRFKIKDIDQSILLVNYWNAIKKYNSKLGARFANVLMQLTKIEGFDLDLLLKKIELRPMKLVTCSSAAQYRQLIEDIYNYKNRSKINLRIK